MQVTSAKTLREKSRQFVKCPSGNVYLMRRPLMADVINTGLLPDNFMAETLKVLGREVEQKEITDKDLLNMDAAHEAMITAAMLEPKIVEHSEEDDEIEYRDIPKEDREHLYKWCAGQLPDVEIETEGGETTVGAVETFSDEGPGSPVEGISDSSQTHRTERKSLAGVA